MNLIIQPRNSSICGQCCIAMVSGKSLDEVFDIFGHTHSTRTKDLIDALTALNISCGTKRIRISKNTTLPNRCILNMKTIGVPMGHWIVKWDDKIYDPSGYEFVYGTMRTNAHVKLTSYLEIFSDG